MPEKEDIYSSKLKSTGVFPFKDFYKFCYGWLSEEGGLNVAEVAYTEKVDQDTKVVEYEWKGTRKVTDYFKFEVKLKARIDRLTEVEILQDSKKIKMNKGIVEYRLKGTLIRDWQGKYDKTAFLKFLRSIYEKWVIASRVEQIEDDLFELCDEFLAQAKAYLDLTGKK